MKHSLKLYKDEDYNRAIKCLPSENDKSKGMKVFIFSVAMKYFMWCILDTLKTIPEIFCLNLKLKYIIQFLIQSNMQIMYYAFAQVWKSRLSMHRDQVHQIQCVWYSVIYYTIILLSKYIRYKPQFLGTKHLIQNENCIKTNWRPYNSKMFYSSMNDVIRFNVKTWSSY